MNVLHLHDYQVTITCSQCGRTMQIRARKVRTRYEHYVRLLSPHLLIDRLRPSARLALHNPRPLRSW